MSGRDSSVKCQEKQGTLSKKGQSTLSGWNKRRFVLSRGSLSYFDGEKLKGTIATRDIQIVRETSDKFGSKNDKKMPCRFEIVIPGRVFYLSAETFKLQHQWIVALESWVGVDTPVTRARSVTATEADERGTHRCKLCGSTYALPEDLVVHVSLRHAAPMSKVDVVASCDFCGATYNSQADLFRHKQMRHGGGNATSQQPPGRRPPAGRGLGGARGGLGQALSTSPGAQPTPGGNRRPTLQRVLSTPVGVGRRMPKNNEAPPFGGLPPAPASRAPQRRAPVIGGAGRGAAAPPLSPRSAGGVPEFKCRECMKAYFSAEDLATHNALRHGASYAASVSEFGDSSIANAAAAPAADSSEDTDKKDPLSRARSNTEAEWASIDSMLDGLDLAL